MNDAGLKYPEDALGTALQILGDRWKIQIIWHLLKQELTEKQLLFCLPDCPDQEMKKCLAELEKQGLICRRIPEDQNTAARYRLTDLGKTASPVTEALENWGKLWIKAARLGIDPMEDEMLWGKEEKGASGENEGRNAGFCANLTKSPWEDGEEKAAYPEKKESRKSAASRHEWLMAEGRFLFKNPHVGYESWYFFGKAQEDKKDVSIWLISEKEYQNMLFQYQNSGKIEDSGRDFAMAVTCKCDDFLPDQEAFYLGIEDALIKMTLGE